MRTCTGPGRDRLAVWSYEEAGEKIPNGDLSVTDAERAAAGRETLAEHFAALLPGNRQRAAERYDAGGLPDGEDMARVWRPRDPAGLRARLCAPLGAPLAEPPLSIWSDGDILEVLWHPPHELRGSVAEYTLTSAALRSERGLTVYQPPGTSRPVPGCLLADGEAVREFAPALDAAIEAGAVPPVLLVGLHNAPGAFTTASDLRAREYVPRYNRRRFDAHLRFATDEVTAWAAEQFGPVTGPWVTAGFSNGAAWAIAAAQRRPDLIGAVAALSAGVVPQRISGAARSAGVRHYLAAGTLEPGFRRSTRQWAERLDRAGLPCRHEEWTGGHDQVWVGAAASGRARLAAQGVGVSADATGSGGSA